MSHGYCLSLFGWWLRRSGSKWNTDMSHWVWKNVHVGVGTGHVGVCGSLSMCVQVTCVDRWHVCDGGLSHVPVALRGVSVTLRI